MISITFDTDHLTNTQLSFFLDNFLSRVPGHTTIFAHDTFDCLLEIDHEVCPHPFITDLTNWHHDLTRLSSFYNRHSPRGVRPHSCVYSHMIGIELNSLGYSYISQAHTLFDTNLRPFRHPWGLWELPIYYMDNMSFWFTHNWPELYHNPFDPCFIEHALSSDSLFVFDFHPLHIALNTTSPEEYQAKKHLFLKDRQNPFDLASNAYGTRNFFLDLCSAMLSANRKSLTCSDIISHYSRSHHP